MKVRFIPLQANHFNGYAISQPNTLYLIIDEVFKILATVNICFSPASALHISWVLWYQNVFSKVKKNSLNIT